MHDAAGHAVTKGRASAVRLLPCVGTLAARVPPPHPIYPRTPTFQLRVFILVSIDNLLILTELKARYSRLLFSAYRNDCCKNSKKNRNTILIHVIFLYESATAYEGLKVSPMTFAT